MRGEKLLSAKELALKIDLNVKTIHRMRQRGDLPAHAFKRRWRFSWKEIAKMTKRLS